jgi:NADH pyrophosphatase NudC (nudix superfamily)
MHNCAQKIFIYYYNRITIFEHNFKNKNKNIISIIGSSTVNNKQARSKSTNICDRRCNYANYFYSLNNYNNWVGLLKFRSYRRQFTQQQQQQQQHIECHRRIECQLFSICDCNKQEYNNIEASSNVQQTRCQSKYSLSLPPSPPTLFTSKARTLFSLAKLNHILCKSSSFYQFDTIYNSNNSKAVAIAAAGLLKMNANANLIQRGTVNYFAHSFIDRCSDKRKNKRWIDEQLRAMNTVFILFQVDKPFVIVDEQQKMFQLYKFNYEQVSFLIDVEKSQGELNDTKSSHSDNNNNSHNKSNGQCDEKPKNGKYKSTIVFLGLEYEKNTNQTLENISPYSNPDAYNKQSYRPWFAIDINSCGSEIENISQMLSKYGQFFEGNFLRMMAIQDHLESSIIAQARSVFCWLDRNKYCASCGMLNQVEDSGRLVSFI